MSYRTSKRENDVLLVDDDAHVRELYTVWLEGDFTVTAVSTGEEALETLDNEFDIILLDRDLSGWKGPEVLAEFRERGFDQPVIMITGIEPDTDIIELPIDEYLVKPVSEDELLAAVSFVLQLGSYDDMLREYYSLISKAAALRSSKSPTDVRTQESCRELERRISSLEACLEVAREEFGECHYHKMFRKVLG